MQTIPLAPETYINLPCTGLTEMYYSFVPEDINRARTLCLTCEHKDKCLDGAIARDEPDGVWGGFLVIRGKIVTFKRSVGKPHEGTYINALSYDETAVPERHRGMTRTIGHSIRDSSKNAIAA